MTAHETVLQHELTCTDPSNVTITNGVTKQLLHCRSCDAEVFVKKERPSSGAR